MMMRPKRTRKGKKISHGKVGAAVGSGYGGWEEEAAH